MSAPVFYPHAPQTANKARYSPDKDKIRKELGIPLGGKIEDARTCMHGGKCTKQCECVTCKKFAELVAAGTAKYDEEDTHTPLGVVKEPNPHPTGPPKTAEKKQKPKKKSPGYGYTIGDQNFKHGEKYEEDKEEDAQGFGQMTDADLARHREAMLKGEYIPKPPPKEQPKEKDCESCSKYSLELTLLTERYARRGPGILGEEEQHHLQASVEPPEHKPQHESEPDRSPHGHTMRAFNASSKLQFQHGSVGEHHQHAMHASAQGDHDLAARHHNLAADAHDAKSHHFSTGASGSFGSDDFAARQHHHAAYLHRSAALAHTYPEEAEKEKDALINVSGNRVSTGDVASGNKPQTKIDAGIVPMQLSSGNDVARYAGVSPLSYKEAVAGAKRSSDYAHRASHVAHTRTDVDSEDHGLAARMHDTASAAHRVAGNLAEDHDQKTYHDIMDKHHQQLHAHHTDIAELQG